MTLHAQVIRKKGNKRFVILPYQEFLRVRELLEDYEDLRDLRRAKAKEGHLPGTTLTDVVKRLNLTRRTTRCSRPR